MYVSHLQCFEQVNWVLLLGMRDESDSSAFVSAPASSTDPMDIVFKMVWTLKVYD